MKKIIIINEVQARRISNFITEETLGEDVLYGEYMKYIESIGRRGTLPPQPFNPDDEFWYLIGASTFFLGYSSEGEFDEYEFADFLDYFFGKYGEGVLRNGVTKDDVYNTFLPSDMETGLTPDGFKKYQFELISRGKKSFGWLKDCLTFNDKGQIYCERAIQLGDDMRAEDFTEEYGDGIGIYWSFQDGGAKTYYSWVDGPVLIFKGWVNPCDVNWGESIQTQSADEQELRLDHGATVQVDQIVTDYAKKNLLRGGSILLQA